MVNTSGGMGQRRYSEYSPQTTASSWESLYPSGKSTFEPASDFMPEQSSSYVLCSVPGAVSGRVSKCQEEGSY